MLDYSLEKKDYSMKYFSEDLQIPAISFYEFHVKRYRRAN